MTYLELLNQYSPKETQVRCIKFMLECLTQVRQKLPPVALAALDTFLQHWPQSPDHPDLEVACETCWGWIYFRRFLVSEEERALRGVLCVLPPYSENIPDALERLGFFFECMRQAGCKTDAMDKTFRHFFQT